MIAQLERPRRVLPVSPGFVDAMTDHLFRCFPRESGALGEAVTRQAVVEGIAKAWRYAITGDGAVCLFIDLLFAFGPDFDTDPQYSWTHGILRDTSRDPETRMRGIFDIGLCLTRYHRCR